MEVSISRLRIMSANELVALLDDDDKVKITIRGCPRFLLSEYRAGNSPVKDVELTKEVENANGGGVTETSRGLDAILADYKEGG